VKLSAEERERLDNVIHRGKHPAQRLLKAGAGEAGEAWSGSQIAKALDTSLAAIARTRQQRVEEGFEAVLTRKHSPASARTRIFDGAAAAKLIALAGSEPPKGRARWTLSRLEDKVVELNIVERAGDNTIGRTLKNRLKPHLREQFVIPPEANAAFVAAMSAFRQRELMPRNAKMEDVLEAYRRPHDPDRPLVCLDETSKQLIAETRVPIPAKSGKPERYDYQYERNGTVNLFMMFAPLEGWRHAELTDRHTAVDYAQVLKDLSDTHYAKAAKIVLVQDNLNTRKPASLYAAFPAGEARRLAERFEWHYTPKHGSWLDMAEAELGVLSARCLDRRIADKRTLTGEAAAREDNRDKHHAKADWQFATADARIKLKRLYPAF
jgi:hypothetical protein